MPDTITVQPYYDAIGPEARDRLFAVMRAIDTKAQDYFAAAARLAAPSGSIAVGGGQFEQVLKAEVLSSYLRILRRGGTPSEALANAEKDRRAFVLKWNAQRRGDHVVHRCPDTSEQSLIEDAHRRVLRASEG